MNRLRLLDRYALRLTLWPLVGALVVTLIALLLERLLRLLDLLSQSNDRFGFVLELTANLVPHYLGLTLPAAFFVALFIVAARLGDGSEIDAMLASGQSLTRLIAPYVCLGLALAGVSLILFGFIQPYSRYAYREVLHVAQEAGWSGRVSGGAVVTAGDGLVLTADGSDAGGMRLTGLFVRRLSDDGSEEIITAARAEIRVDRQAETAELILHDGRLTRLRADGQPRVFVFNDFVQSLPLAGPDRLLRRRGGDERELTLVELVHRATGEDADGGTETVTRGALLAELYGRLSRALALPFLPLLAMPLGLAAKRSGRAPGVIVAGVILIGFQNLLQFGQSLAETGRVAALPAVGLPFAAFAGLCLWIFLASRERPGDTPISHLTEALQGLGRAIGGAVTRLRRRPTVARP